MRARRMPTWAHPESTVALVRRGPEMPAETGILVLQAIGRREMAAVALRPRGTTAKFTPHGVGEIEVIS